MTFDYWLRLLGSILVEIQLEPGAAQSLKFEIPTKGVERNQIVIHHILQVIGTRIIGGYTVVVVAGQEDDTVGLE